MFKVVDHLLNLDWIAQMASLRELEDPIRKEQFVQDVLSGIEEERDEEVNTNHGISSLDELIENSKKGSDIKVDWDLIKE